MIEGNEALATGGGADGGKANWVSGHGGGIHASAGGVLRLVGPVEVRNNSAKNFGGGGSVKTASGYLESNGLEIVKIVGNRTTNAQAPFGNGGGIFLSESDHDEPLFSTSGVGAGSGAHFVFGHGGLFAEGVRVKSNKATRWGGGIYYGYAKHMEQGLSSEFNIHAVEVDNNTADGTSKNPPSLTLPRLQVDCVALEHIDVGNGVGYRLKNSNVNAALRVVDVGVYGCRASRLDTTGTTIQGFFVEKLYQN